jgi:hypothetical protein
MFLPALPSPDGQAWDYLPHDHARSHGSRREQVQK